MTSHYVTFSNGLASTLKLENQSWFGNLDSLIPYPLSSFCVRVMCFLATWTDPCLYFSTRHETTLCSASSWGNLGNPGQDGQIPGHLGLRNWQVGRKLGLTQANLCYSWGSGSLRLGTGSGLHRPPHLWAVWLPPVKLSANDQFCAFFPLK